MFGTPQQLTAEGINAYEPQVSVDPQGNAIAVWRVFDGTNYRIETAFRPVGGQFQAWKLLSEAGKNAKEPQVAFDPQGNATAVWTLQDGAFRIESAFRPAGGTFGEGHPISPPPHSSSDSQVTTDPQGNAVAVWRGYDGSNKRIETAFRAAGSGFFGLPQRISAAGKDATAPQLATHPVGNAIAVWESEDGANLSVEAALRPAGGSFGAPQQISAAGQSEFNPQIATDSEGNAIAVWQRFDGSSWRTEAAGFDAAGPQMRSLSIPASAERGRPAAFSVAPFDVWSPVAATSWSFGDGGSAQGSAVSHAFAKPGNYPVTVASTDAVGNSSSAAGTVMVKDTIKPAISRLQVRPNAVRVAAPRKRARGSAALRPKRGGKKKSGRKRKVAKIRFRLSEPARVTFTAKRRVRRRCGKRRCVKLVAVKGKRTVAGKQGANAVRFDGRLGRRKLAPGRYVLSARAIDPYGNRSRQPVTRSFRVIR